MANNSSVCGQVRVFISEKSQEKNSFKDKVKLLTLLQNILEDLDYPTFLQINFEELNEVDLLSENPLIIDFSAVGKWEFEKNIQFLIELLTKQDISFYPKEFQDNLIELQSLLKYYCLGLNFTFYEIFSWTQTVSQTTISLYDFSQSNQQLFEKRFGYDIVSSNSFHLTPKELEVANSFSHYEEFQNFVPEELENQNPFISI